LLHDEDIQMFGKESSGQHIKSLSYSSKDLDKLKLHFVQPSVKSGIIPEILRYLIDERRHLRTQLATTHDPAQRFATYF
jgi:hypothetical protein